VTDDHGDWHLRYSVVVLGDFVPPPQPLPAIESFVRSPLFSEAFFEDERGVGPSGSCDPVLAGPPIPLLVLCLGIKTTAELWGRRRPPVVVFVYRAMTMNNIDDTDDE
jgi:hypothetical protein